VLSLPVSCLCVGYVIYCTLGEFHSYWLYYVIFSVLQERIARQRYAIGFLEFVQCLYSVVHRVWIGVIILWFTLIIYACRFFSDISGVVWLNKMMTTTSNNIRHHTVTFPSTVDGVLCYRIDYCRLSYLNTVLPRTKAAYSRSMCRDGHSATTVKVCD